MKIRPYCIGEEAALWSLLFNTVRQVNIKDYSEAQVEAWAPGDFDMDQWIVRLQQTQPWVAEQEGQLLGFAELDETGRIGCFYCHHASMGEGIGSALLQVIEAEALRLGLTQLSVEASITARGFFERKGFTIGSAQRVTRRGEVFLNYLMFKNIVN
ncbi:MAG: GNAT family N-acetyltransferase [Candidatus Thiodiazotropha sp. (ex Notomyrtea botanica)]|nr:GNAT family N-acetyltransferase [Candidatus Thiodiazotropha sp. (ex Notomyrtea botanica)]